MKTLFRVFSVLTALIFLSACHKEQTITSVSITPSSVEMKVGETFQLEVEVVPAEIETEFEWISGNPATVSVENGKLTALAAGTSKVILLVGGLKAECLVTVVDPEDENGLKSIQITSGDLNLIVGDSKKLAVELDPANAPVDIIWVSTDEKAVSVSQEGVIEALAPGEAQIKAIVGNLSDMITVKVSEPVLESISLNREELVLDMGTEYELIAYVAPETFLKDLQWKTLDNKVATVTSSGLVTAVGPGTTEVVAYIGSVEARCEVTVENLDIFVLITRNHVSLHKGEGYQLEVTVDPVEALEKYGVEWRSDDESIVSVTQDGKVEGINSGFTRIYASVAGKESSCVVGVLDEKIKPDWEKFEVFHVEGYGDGLVIKKDQHFITVLSFEYAEKKWAEDASVVVGNGETAYFDKDGILLTQAIGKAAENHPGNFPAYDWVKSIGEKWYLPSPVELNEICDYYGRQDIDKALLNLGKAQLPETVWSSAETKRTPFTDAGFWKERYVVESSKSLLNGCIALMKVMYK